VFGLHRAFSPDATVAEVDAKCRSAGWGCVDCKKALFEHMNAELTPIRARAQALAEQPRLVDDALDAGAEKARVVARQTMGHVKERMGLA
jgi:tryptophanyl-tRNA synthetase